MAKVSLTDAKQAKVVEALRRMYNISPCVGTANECAAVWGAVFGNKTHKAQNWSVWATEKIATIDPEDAAG